MKQAYWIEGWKDTTEILNIDEKRYNLFRLKGDCRSVSYNKCREDLTDEHSVLLHKVFNVWTLSLPLSVSTEMQKTPVLYTKNHSGHWCGIALFFKGFPNTSKLIIHVDHWWNKDVKHVSKYLKVI